MQIKPHGGYIYWIYSNTTIVKKTQGESLTILLKELHHGVGVKEQLPAFTVWHFWFQVVLRVSAGGAQLWKTNVRTVTTQGINKPVSLL